MKIAVKIMQLPSDEHQQQSMEHESLQWIKRITSNWSRFLLVFTGGENCVYGYDPEISSTHGSVWDNLFFILAKESLPVDSNISLLICFFNTDGIIHKEFIALT